MTRVFEDDKNNHHDHHGSLGILTQGNDVSKLREKNSQLYLSLSLNKMQNKIEGEAMLL